ncbi:MAG: hypothetical protein BWX79_02426 [Alphaproteobacteria bacterium ADurb.Bin100]|nr:MAG: hypothetical protein BWX79_02426 [Alphaproteobacteria bacterium ADurb.Bin100]
MREPVQQGAGQPFTAHDLGPLLEGQVGGHDQAGALVGPADHVEEQLRAGLGEGHIAQFVQHEQIQPLQLLLKPLQLPVLPLLQELGDEAGGGEEAHAAALLAGGEGQSRGQMRLAGATVADQQHILPLIHVLPPQQLPHQFLVQRRLGFEVKGIQRLEHREARGLDAPLGRPPFASGRLHFGQAQQVRLVIISLLLAHCRQLLVLAQEAGQLQLLEVVLQQHGGLGFAHGAPPPAIRAA